MIHKYCISFHYIAFHCITSLFIAFHCMNRPQLIQNKGDIEIKFDEAGQDSGALLTLTGGTNGQVIRLIIHNKSRENPATLTDFSHFYLYKQSSIKLSDRENVSKGNNPHVIPPMRELK